MLQNDCKLTFSDMPEGGFLVLRKYMIKMIIALSVALTCLFVVSFGKAVYSVVNPAPSEAAPAPIDVESETLKDNENPTIVGLGDSITRGVGDEADDGYFQRTVKTIEKSIDKDVTATNLAVTGATSPELLQQLEEPGTQNAVRSADIIIMSMGANDLSPGAANFNADTVKTLNPDGESYAANTKAIMTKLSELNPDAEIYWLGLYNPFEDIPEFRGAELFIMDWNYILAQAASGFPQVKVIPTYDLFQGNVPDYLYADHYHPNQTGHQTISDRISEVILADLKVGQK